MPNRDGVVEQQAAPARDRAAERLVTFMRCRTAEEYFAALEVDYEPRALAVRRLPILRMFATELARIERPEGQRTHAEQDGPSRPAQLDPVIRLTLYRDALRRSYAAFVRVDEGPDLHDLVVGRRTVAALASVPEAFVGVEEIMIERTREGRP